MGHKSTLQDLKDVHPTIYTSLQKLLVEDNADQLGLVFQVHLPSIFSGASCTSHGLMLFNKDC